MLLSFIYATILLDDIGILFIRLIIKLIMQG
jgi:hypothetical protein